MRLIRLALWFVFPVFLILVPFDAQAVSEKTVRVLVADSQKQIKLSTRGPYVLRAWPSMEILSKGENLSELTLSTAGTALKLGDKPIAARSVILEPRRERDLYLNEARFRGSMRVMRALDGTLSAINVLGIEGYLYGVLHHEVAPWWPMDALKAQAIAARTYAFYQALTNTTQEFDLKNNTSSQVYGGSTTERYRTRNAVDLTRGQILTFERKVFPAYFNATCGGTTAASDELWNISLPPLKGGISCSYCKISPHFFWRRSQPLAQIEDMMRQRGQDVGRILKIAPISRTLSGRVGSIRITGTLKDYVIAAKDFRIWIGGDKIRSTRFLIEIVDDVAQFTGEGWGHGVGLCQWGALGQSLIGHGHEKILSFYYPYSAITNYLDVPIEAHPTTPKPKRANS